MDSRLLAVLTSRSCIDLARLTGDLAALDWKLRSDADGRQASTFVALFQRHDNLAAYGNAIEGKKDTFNLDASASWQVTEQVQVTLEALNLTDEENHQFVGDGGSRESTSVYHHTGRQVFVGARYRF